LISDAFQAARARMNASTGGHHECKEEFVRARSIRDPNSIESK
jgi:hypothetical protein